MGDGSETFEFVRGVLDLDISDKVSLYPRFLIAAIILFAVGVIVGFPTTIETKVQIVSATATSTTVLYVLSENLRASTVKKLDYWNKKVYTPLLSITRQQIQAESPGRAETLGRYRDWLKKWGKVGIVKLYPKRLILTLDMVTTSAKNYESTYKVIRAKGIGFVGSSYHSKALYYVLDKGDRENFDMVAIGKHQEFIDSLSKTEPNLLTTFIKESDFLEAQLAYLKSEIEKFYLENQLEAVPEGGGLLPGNLFVPRY
jgi:hypothetical protein